MIKKRKKKDIYRDIFNDGINLPFHFCNYILTASNMIGEGLTNLIMVIPGLYASLSLIILSPLYKYTEIGRKHAFHIGIEGLKSIPKKVLSGIISILLSPIAYPIVLIRKKKEPVEKEIIDDISVSSAPFVGTSSVA
jgi:hypothetical protein